MAKLKISTAVLLLVVALFEAIAAAQEVAPATRRPKQNALYPTAAGPPVVPGVERMTRGIDITKLNLYSASLSPNDGFANRILDLTYEKNKTWFNPSNSQLYKQPDVVSGVNTISAGKLTSTSDVSGESNDYKDGIAAKVGIELTPDKKDEDKTDDEKKADDKKKGSFSASMSFKDFQENIYKKDETVAETLMTVSAIKVDFRRARFLTLNPDFERAMANKLTRVYEDIPLVYDRFVDNYGTHYFDTGILGGYLSLHTTIKNEYMRQSDEIGLKSDLKATFFEKVTIDSDVEDHAKWATEKFKNSSDSHFRYFGGLPSLIPTDPKFMETWAPSVFKDPSILGGKLSPIEDLIANETIKAEVSKAIAVKRARAYLQELQNAIMFGEFKLNNDQSIILTDLQRDLASTDKKNLKFLIEDMDYLFRLITHLRDKLQLGKVKNELDVAHAKVIDCKGNLERQCAIDAARREIQDKNLEFIQARQKVTGLIQNEPPRYDHGEVKQAIQSAAQTMYYHLNTVVDFCWGDKTCGNCVKRIMDPRNSNPDGKHACDNPTIRGLVKLV